MKKICFIHRSPRPEYFSIEKVFSAVRKELNGSFEIEEIAAPHSRVTPWHLVHNIISVSNCRADIYHITGDAHYLALARPGKQTVLTIHDCVFLKEQKRWKRFLLKKIMLDMPVHHSRIVTTISENTRRDIISNTGCSPDKVVVIPNPVDDKIYFSSKDFNQECPVILFVGTTPNKNLPRVIEAIKGIPCVLDIIGKIPPEHIECLEQNGIRFTQSFSISQAELSEKYASADFLLFPTTFEGFGLPIVEAQRAGRAVITSDLSPMREVAGEGACLVDPYDVASIRNAVTKIIKDRDYRLALIRKGTNNVERFTAKATASGYKKVYDDMLQ